jgi:hypothetical protein
MPFFNKIIESDIFIILGHCDFEKNNYQNRFFFEDRWLTMSVEATRKRIVDKLYKNPTFDWMKIKKQLHQYPLGIFDEFICESVFTTNVGIIKKCCQLLNINTRIEVDFSTSLKSTDRLVELCKTFKGTTYLSGPSGKNYLDLNKFTNKGIAVEFFHSNTKDHILNSLRKDTSCKTY